MAVPVTMPGPTFVSPPTMPVPQNSAHWSMPLTMSYAAWASRSNGRASAARSPVGLAPIAARSLKFTAAAYHPNCSYVIPAGKCLSKVTMSVETTVPPPMTAASSPGPTVPSGLMNPLKSSINWRSPNSPNRTVMIPPMRMAAFSEEVVQAADPRPRLDVLLLTSLTGLLAT